MIDKELLSEVFNKKVRTFTIVDNIVYYQYEDIYYGGISGIDDEEINIYELAHKCKEWAYNNGFNISSTNGYMGDNTPYAYAISSNGEEFPFIEAYTEQQAVFKVCDYILKELI